MTATVMTVLICLASNMPTCDTSNALHSWTKNTSSRACTIYANAVGNLGGDVGANLNGPFQYQMRPNERVKVICAPTGEQIGK